MCLSGLADITLLPLELSSCQGTFLFRKFQSAIYCAFFAAIEFFVQTGKVVSHKELEKFFLPVSREKNQCSMIEDKAKCTTHVIFFNLGGTTLAQNLHFLNSSHSSFEKRNILLCRIFML